MDTLQESQQLFSLVLTKVDKIKHEKDIRPKADAVIEQITSAGLSHANPIVHLVSSYTGFGLKELKSDCVFILEQEKLTKKV